jgi:protein-S-isoprenylcysteine O-methyltransferase Ste14
MVSFVPLGFGVYSLASKGKTVTRRVHDSHLYAFEKTTELVTTGIFHYIRHPMYSSLLLLAWGLFFKLPAWPSALLVFIATVFLFATAKADEAECVRFFGPAYQAYMERSKRFLPFLF